MIERIIELSLRNRFLVLFVTVMIGAVGVWAMHTLPVDAIPDLSDVQVIVYTSYPGQAPQVVEDQVTYPLSTAMLSVPYAATVRGYSFFGLSMIYVIFEDGTDLYWARSRVLEYLNYVQARLPAGITPQLGPDATSVGWIYQYTLSDFSPRARVLRANLNRDAAAVLDVAELPEAKDRVLLGGARVCKFKFGKWCLVRAANTSEEVSVYTHEQLRDFFKTVSPPATQTQSEFQEESIAYLLDGFDRDRDGHISPAELLRAANFQGLDLAQLRSLQDWYFRYDLMSLEGVSEVASIGGFVRQYQVEVDPEKMRAFGVTIPSVMEAIREANLDVSGHLIEMAETEFMVRGQGYIKSIADLETVPVGSDPDRHSPVLLGQVARVQIGPESRRGIVEMNGEGEVVSGIVLLRMGGNALDVIERVEARIAELKLGLPEGVELHVSYDRSQLIHRAISTLQGKILEEIFVVALVCIVFLLHFRSAFVAMLTVPIGILVSFIVMRWLGINANIMSLGGIAIAIGVMVDASVVMVENLHKHREREGATDSEQLVLNSAKEVGPALFFSLLIITISFLPIFVLEQQEGRLLTPLAYTKTFSMAAAAILSITLIPVLMFYFVRGKVIAERDNPISKFLIAKFHPINAFALKRPKQILFAAVLIVLSGLIPLKFLGSEFMAPLDEGDLLYMPTTPPGISITKARELVQQMDRIIATHPQVAHVLGKAGRAETATDPAPLSMVETTILLRPKEEWPKGKRFEDIVRELDAMLTFPGVTNSWTMPIQTRIDMLATGIKTPVGIKLLGDDLNALSEVGQQIEAVVRQLPNTASVYSERVTGGSYIDIRVRRSEAARYGLNVGDVQRIISSAIGGMNVTETVEGLERYPVNLRFPRELRSDLEAIARIAVPTPLGHTVPLAQVAEIKITKDAPEIRSENARRALWIFVTPNTRDLGGYVANARKVVEKQVQLPSGMSLVWSGQYEYMQRAKARLLFVVPLTLAIIFLLLYLHFRNFRECALVLIGTIFFAPVGGVWLMYWMGFQWSIAVGVGFIALAGLAAETGVVMLVYLQEACARYAAEGRLHTLDDLRSAVTEGTVDRLRPKLMTVLTTLIGLLPILFGDETGTPVMKPIAAPMVGGMVSSLILTLVILPVAFYWLKARELQRGHFDA